MEERRSEDEVAVGLLAGGEEIRRMRGQLAGGGWTGRVWQHFLVHLNQKADSGALHQLADLVLGAVVTGQADLRDAAVASLLRGIHLPQDAYVDRDAGCMSLTGVHRAYNLALATDWLWPRLNRDQREAAVGALVAHCAENLTRMPDGIRDEGDGRGRLLFARRLDRSNPHSLHPERHQLNNWDLWFAGGLYMIASLAERAWLAPDGAGPKLVWGHYYETGYEMTRERVDRWKGIARTVIEQTIENQLGPDGDLGEGISYANYGGSALVLALTTMERVDGINLFSEKVFQLPLWQASQMLEACAVNFNDAKLTTRLGTPYVAMLARRSQDPRLQALLIEQLELRLEAPNALVMLGLDETLEPTSWRPPRTAAYRRTGTVIWQPEPGEAGFYCAMQSGAHGGAHQHRDRNGFFLAAEGKPLLVDTGDGRYFSNPTFADTISHNCILIDGRGQFGDNQRPTAGRLVQHQEQGGIRTALFDAGGCYEGVDHVFRRAVLVRPGIVVIGDRVAGECEWLTWLAQGFNGDGASRWCCKGRQLVLERPAQSLHLFFVQEPEEATVESAPLDGGANGILRLAVRIAGQRAAVVCVLELPGGPAPVAAWSGEGLSIGNGETTVRVQQNGDALVVDGTSYSC